jgi:hypothetical protein
MGILKNELRNGNFTSSEIYKLMALDRSGKDFGSIAKTYIAETNYERMLANCIDNETNSKEMSWGNLLEPRVFELLGLEYVYSSQETSQHPLIDYWAGSTDGVRAVKDRAVFDIKAPFTKKSFCQLCAPIVLGYTGIKAVDAIRNGFTHNGFTYPAHPKGDAYYYQLVSNACIHNTNHVELIVYMPYQSELLDIKQLADGNPSCYWMNFASEDEIPYLVDGGMFKNLNKISFEVPQADKDLLTANVLKAGRMLIPRKALQQAA